VFACPEHPHRVGAGGGCRRGKSAPALPVWKQPDPRGAGAPRRDHAHHVEVGLRLLVARASAVTMPRASSKPVYPPRRAVAPAATTPREPSRVLLRAAATGATPRRGRCAYSRRSSRPSSRRRFPPIFRARLSSTSPTTWGMQSSTRQRCSHPSPLTLHPSTLNPQPSPLTPHPSTLNPQPSQRQRCPRPHCPPPHLPCQTAA